MDYDLERYPIITKIKNFIEFNRIGISRIKTEKRSKYGLLVATELTVKNNQFTVLVDDEYDDLKKKNSLLNYVLVFRSLAILDDSSDYLDWCSQQDLNANTPNLLAYYQLMSSQIETIKLLFKNHTINYFITDLDFQLNSGAIAVLRKH
jgi:hypothetical protein